MAAKRKNVKAKTKTVKARSEPTMTFSPKGGLHGTVTFNPPFMKSTTANVLLLGQSDPDLEQTLLLFTISKNQIILLEESCIYYSGYFDSEDDELQYALSVFARDRSYYYDKMPNNSELSGIMKKLTPTEIKTLRSYLVKNKG